MRKPRVMSPVQAGRQFDPPVGPERVRQLCDRGELEFLRGEGPYGTRLIFVDSIEAYLARRKLAAGQAN